MWYRKRDRQVLDSNKPGFYHFHKLRALGQVSKSPPNTCFLSSKVLMVNLTFGLFVRINSYHVHIYPLPHVGHIMLVNMSFPFLLLLPTSVNLGKIFNFLLSLTHTHMQLGHRNLQRIFWLCSNKTSHFINLHICVTISCIMRLWNSLEIKIHYTDSRTKEKVEKNLDSIKSKQNWF